MFDQFKQSKDAKRRKLFCNDCGIRTIHNPIASKVGFWDDPINQVNGGQSFSMYQCGGCDTVCYLTSSWDSEDIEQDYDGGYYQAHRDKQYPAPLEKGFSFDKSHTPGKIDNLLDELVSGFLAANYVSSTLLMRVIIEYLVNEAECVGSTLEKKITDLANKGLVDEDQRDLLQEIRKKGNKSAHEAQALSSSALRSGFEIVSLLIDQLYNRPGRAEAAVKKAKRHFAPSDNTNG